jgi:quinol monooxygenase YgiN
VRIEAERDIEQLRTKALLLRKENERLSSKVVELLRENLLLKGMSAQQLQQAVARFRTMEAMAELTVIARVKAKPGREAELERALQEVVGATHEEPGCLRYALHRSTEDPATFLLVERWASRAAHEEHRQTPHFKALFAKLTELLHDQLKEIRHSLN